MRILLITFVIPILIEGWVNFPQVQKDPFGGIETTGNGRGIFSNAPERILSRAKRNAMQFALMIWCETKRYPMAYNGYGCHCGIGGKGEPLDEIDRCCLIHDKCYDNIIDNKICGSLKSAVYLTFYWRSGCSSCALFNSTCQKALCECDGEAARCFKRNEFAFHSRSRNYDKSLCK